MKTSFSWMGMIKIIYMVILPKVLCRFNIPPIIIPLVGNQKYNAENPYAFQHSLQYYLHYPGSGNSSNPHEEMIG